MTIVKFAQQHQLWHYHIGIPEYEKAKGVGNYTSDWVIHYQQLSPSEVKLVEVGDHKPFTLPKQITLESLFQFGSINTKNRPY